MEFNNKLNETITNFAIEELIKITKNTWTESVDSNLHDYSINLTFDGISTEGRGTSHISNIALYKAFSEAVERYIFNKYELKSTNGCAVHFEIEMAKNNSKIELIERDLFGLFFNYEINLNNASKIPQLSKIYKYIESECYEIYHHSIKNNELFFIITFIRNKDIFFSGTSAGYQNDQAIIHSTYEALRHFSHYIHSNYKPKNFDKRENFDKIIFDDYTDHGDLSLNSAYAKKIFNLINLAGHEININIPNSFEYSSIEDKLLTKASLFFSKCENRQLLELPLGMYKISDSVKSRLQKYNPEINKLRNTDLPHFLR